MHFWLFGMLTEIQPVPPPSLSGNLHNKIAGLNWSGLTDAPPTETISNSTPPTLNPSAFQEV